MLQRGLACGGLAIVVVALFDCAPADVTATSFPEAEAMMAEASPPTSPPTDTRRVRLDTVRQTAGEWRSPGAIAAHLTSARSMELETNGVRVGIERAFESEARAKVQRNVVRYRGEIERFVFARGAEIEELALLTRPVEQVLAYRLVLPNGYALHSLSSSIVEITDRAGAPWLRMRADRAWSANRNSVPISLAIEGDVVRVNVPSDATYPLLVDPTWSSAQSLSGWLHIVANGVLSRSLPVEIGPAQPGAECRYDAECASNFCVVDGPPGSVGVCCNARCEEPCEACTMRRKGAGDDGTCGAVPPGKDPDKKCFLGRGVACTSREQCGVNQFCAQGVCCDGECAGTCQSCALPSSVGTCKAIDPCDLACDGDHTLKKAGVADVDCAPFKCTGTQCRIECGSAKDCVEPAVCSFDGRCVAPPNVRRAARVTT